MAVLVNRVLIRLVSASALPFVGFSSAKPSSSVSLISAQRRYAKFGFSSATHSSSFRLVPAQRTSPEFDNERVLAKVIEVKNELAQSKAEIEKLRAVMESKLMNLEKVLNSLKKIDQEFSAEHVSEGPKDNKRKRNEDTSGRDDSHKKSRHDEDLSKRNGFFE